MYIPVTWLFPVTDIDIPVIGYECCWYVMCWTKCHVDLSHGGHLYLLFLVSRYLVLCYQQSSCAVIMFQVPCTILVLATLCTVNIIKITWGCGRLDGWLDLIEWMYWIYIYPTAWDGSATYLLYIAPWAPVSRFLLPLSGGPWSQQPGDCLRPWSWICTGYTYPIRAPWPLGFQIIK